MSWFVQRLLMETTQIKGTHDFEADDYNNLLIIEKKISDMVKNDLLTRNELRILELIKEGYLFSDIESMVGVGRETVSKTYKNICEKIAFSLGGEFTDDGFIKEVSKRHHLTKEEERKLSRFMESNLKHKILRKPTRKENSMEVIK
jgi:hypothetical protein